MLFTEVKGAYVMLQRMNELISPLIEMYLYLLVSYCL